MTKREAQELKMGLSSPFGRWIITHMKLRSNEIKEEAVAQIPGNILEINEREQNFGAGKVLAELVNQIPNTIDELIRKSTE